MSVAKWISCCAVVGAWLLVCLARAGAQHDVFGESETSTPANTNTPGAERSLLSEDRQATATDGQRDFCRCVGEVDSPAVARIEKALRRQLRATGLDFIDTPLEAVVNLLQDDYEMPIQLDSPALEEVGLGPEEPVTVNIHNISLRSALRLMLKQLGLTYVIRDEVLLITTPQEAEANLLTCVYDVRGLTTDDGQTTLKDLMDTIIACVATETWNVKGGGEAEIRALTPGLLVISQTQAVHDEIRGLLEVIRQMRRERPAPEEAAVATKRGGEQVVARFYPLQVASPENAEQLRFQIRELIVNSLPDQRWSGRLEDGQAVVLAVLPDRVVARHKPSVQRELETLLEESGVAMPAPPEGREKAVPAFGRGGFGGGGYGGGGGGFGGGGGGGGFFQPAPVEDD